MLLNADGKGEMHNLTESGYSDGNAKWVLGGKAMVWFSDRAGYRSHGSWGAQYDAYITLAWIRPMATLSKTVLFKNRL